MSLLIGALALSITAAAAPSDPDAHAGLVVEQVLPAADVVRAGLEPGDILLSWSREAAGPHRPAARGDLRTPLDLMDVEVEQLPRGRVKIVGQRGTAEMSWTFPSMRFAFVAGPRLQGSLLAAYEGGRQLAAAKPAQPAEAAEKWQTAAAEALAAGHARLGLWLYWKGTHTLAEARLWPDADKMLETAIAEAERTNDIRAQLILIGEQGDILRRRRMWAPAEKTMRRLVALEAEQETVSLAINLDYLGYCAWWVKQEPTMGVAEYERAFAILEKLAPESYAMARAWGYLGIGAAHQKDLGAAEKYQRRGLEIAEAIAPGDKPLVVLLTNLGKTLYRQGDIVGADEMAHRALRIAEKTPEDEAVLADVMLDLVQNATHRLDYATTEQYALRVLPFYENTAPDSLVLAQVLNHLGIAVGERGDHAAAEAYWRRSLAIKEKLAPYSLPTAVALSNIGRYAVLFGDVAQGEKDLLRVLEILEKAGQAECVDSAGARIYLALGARKRGDFTAAREYARLSLEMMSRLAPGTSEEADVLHQYGLVERDSGNLEAAARLFARSLDAVESQRPRLGGSMESAAKFAAVYSEGYHDAMKALVALHRDAEALHVLERSRSRVWLARMAGRELAFTADLPADLARERREIDQEYDRIEAEIRGLNPAKDTEGITARRTRLTVLREAQDQIVARIAKASPQLASLQYPKPLDFPGVQAALDPGTTLLAYSVGEDETLLFVVQAPPRGGLNALVLPVGAAALAQKVEKLRAAIGPVARASREVLDAQASELYDLLIRPAQAGVDDSRRLLLSLDGPLHSLPFAVLARREGTARASYLIEQKPLHVTASVTVYDQIHKMHSASRTTGGKLVAFGDPVYSLSAKTSARASADSELRSVVRDAAFAPLPATRDEVQGIGRHFKGAEIHLGADATEEHAKAVDTKARYVHFACHAFLDERSPLSSGLVLTLPEAAQGRDNGLLQAWEVFDHVRLDADLVTLSGCRTALGTEMSGEGLLGLTRAFHHAGARAVLGSLWAVSDKSTAQLMKSFYGHLTAGESLDESLRAAQLELIRQPGAKGAQAQWSRPFHWAAFQLSGDWR
jgi:CHAT domain-containing protein/tetratricopeptide (TPR) repeat protein